MLWVRIGFEIPNQHDTWQDDHLIHVKVNFFVKKTYSKNISSFLMHFSWLPIHVSQIQVAKTAQSGAKHEDTLKQKMTT